MVYDTSDPDWILVGVNADFGFAPANYIEIFEDATPAAAAHVPPPVPDEPPAPSLPQRPTQSPSEAESPTRGPPVDAASNPAAAAIADIIHKQNASAVDPEPPRAPPRPMSSYEPEGDYRDEPSPPPALPRRPPSEQMTPPIRQYSPPEPSRRPRARFADLKDEDGETHVQESPPYPRAGNVPSPTSPSGFHMYNINEMIEVMGKRKKMPTTFGINVGAGVIFISPEDEDQQQEWTVEKLTHYSMEGKHVFVDLVRPSKSVDFHAGSKDTAREIVSALGEICGAYRAEGLREVIEAGTGGDRRKKGQVLYDFMAQGDDEVTVAVGDEVIILDDTKSEEWWMVRRMKNGKEGVVPSSYIEVTGTTANPSAGVDLSMSPVERNRLEDLRSTKDSMRKSRTDSIDSPGSEVGTTTRPERRTSPMTKDDGNQHPQRQKRDSKGGSKPSKLSRSPDMPSDANAPIEPDPSKTRQWTDRTKTFSVEAQFIGLQDGKIHLHKTNGVKIAVPIPKMSVEDLEYVEKLTGVSLDEDKPLSEIRRKSQRADADGKRSGASVVPEYDWFDFFLKAGVGPHQCERYAQNFLKDSMDESILPDISPETLRTLGLKEGDILRVMRYLDSLFNRTGSKSKLRNVSFGGEEVIGNGEEAGSPGGLFSGPGGTLRNNTRKGRPAPAVQASDVVDPKAFEQKGTKSPERAPTPPVPAESEKPVMRGFDDDAWEVKQPTQPTPSSSSAAAPPAASQSTGQKPLAGALADLSLLHPPLQPAPAHPTPSQPPTIPGLPPHTVSQPPPQQPQPTGATPGFFTQLGQPGQQTPQTTGFQQQSRQRPQPPQNMGQSSLIPPPPQRPLSAPQNFSPQNTFGAPPLQPQLTGVPQSGPQLAPQGQSLAELNQQRFQSALQPQQTGMMVPNQFQNGMMPQQTGFQPQSQFGIQQQQQPPFANGQPGFQGLAPQPTGFGGFQPQPQQPMQTGLPPALQPQQTGMNGLGMSYTSSPPPAPPIPQQPTATPLQPQKTGPAPPVRFGVKPNTPNKLQPQSTGLRANLSQASKFLIIHLDEWIANLFSNSASKPVWFLNCPIFNRYMFS